ncbi:MAG: fimbrillin family protein [Bacteroides sp.]|nr:fimbrillin family protein [Bacteroides sp.]
MNRIPFLHTLFFASALLLACGCSSPEQPDVPDVPDTSVPLSISVSTCTGTPVSRTIVSETGTGAGQVDHIGVFLAAEDGYSSYADAAISSVVFNLTNTWTASRPVNLQSKTASLYAWYPVKDKDSNPQLATTADEGKATRTIPIEVSATQTFDGASATACSQADYLYGLDKDKTAGTPAVIKVNNATGNTSPTIYLYHALSQVVFTIEYKATRLPDAEYDYVKSISLSGGSFRAGTGTMQLNDGALAFTDASDATLKFSATKDPQLPGNTGKPATVAYGLVAPGTPGSNSTPVTVNLVLGQKGNDTNDRTLSATTTTWFSTLWEPGKRYTYHLLLDKNDLTFESVGIGEWTPNDKGETPMPPRTGHPAHHPRRDCRRRIHDACHSGSHFSFRS